jgi:membrane fusion protein, multidrug efflux system
MKRFRHVSSTIFTATGCMLCLAKKIPVVTILAALAAGCDQKAGGGPPGMGGPDKALEVGVLTVTATDVDLTQDLPGRISALRTAEVRARVDGIIQKRYFTEGSDVREGEVLYQIEPASYEAALDSAKGTLARAQANLEAARAKERRYKQALQKKAVSGQDYDDVMALLHVYEADVLAGKAAMETARINLGFTKSISPISGRIGKSEVTEGAYVQAAGATLLATVQQIDRVYVDVTQSSSDLLRLKRAVFRGEIQTNDAGQARVKLLLEDGTEYSEEGTLQFADVTVNLSTSSVTVRAIFPNPRKDLLPGMFVRARLVEGRNQGAILVPQLAVTHNPKGEPTAYVVGGKGVAELRVLDISRSIGNQWLVNSGLKAGDQLIVNNLLNIRAGTAIKTVPANLAAVFMPKSVTQ